MRLLIACLLLCSVAAAQPPERAYQYQRMALQAWHSEFGLNAPTSTLAGQIHQESAWRSDARSPFAFGLAQFTEPTAQDMARWRRDLAPADPGDPRWALRAQAYYMARLTQRYPDADESWLLALAAYNSGPGWTDRSRAVCRDTPCCAPGRWAGHVEHAIDSRHADWAVRENRDYVRRIVIQHGPVYQAAGWGSAVEIPVVWQCLVD